MLSVVIPTRGRDRCLARLLASVLEDVRKYSLDLIVVNDAADASIHVPPGVRVLHSGGSGPANARNIGARAAAGNLLLFLDDDSVAPAGYVDRIMDTARRFGPGTAFAGPQHCLPNATSPAQASRTLLDWFTSAECDPQRNRLFLPSNGLAVFRSDFDRAGGFNARFRDAAGEDRELSSRLRNVGVTLLLDSSLALLHEFPPTVRTFLLQQWRYGRGARQYARIATGSELRPRSAQSYFSLLREATRRGGLTTASLCAAAQCLVLAGFLWEFSTEL